MASKQRANNEGNIRPRVDGRWEARITLPNGKRKSYYGQTRREVQHQLTDGLRDLQRGIPIPTDRQTVAQYLAHWLELKQAKLRPITFVSYERLIRLYLVPALGTVKLAALTPDHIDRLLKDMADRNLSPRTRQYTHAIIRGALNHATRRGVVSRNAATLVEAPRLPHREHIVLTEDQADALLTSIAGDRLEALYTVALTLGLREGEALGLRWQDVDFAGRTLWVRHELQRVREQPGETRKPVLVEPKSATSRRSIALPDTIVAALHRHRAVQHQQRLLAGARWHEMGHVFTTTVGTPLDNRDVLRRFKSLVSKASLPDMTFHELRHSCATLMLALGVPMRMVMEQLGHSQIATTANLYTSVLPSVKRDAADRMDALLQRRQKGRQVDCLDGQATQR